MTKHPLFDLLKRLKESPIEYPQLQARRAAFVAQMETRLSMGFAALMPDEKAENIAVFPALGKHVPSRRVDGCEPSRTL